MVHRLGGGEARPQQRESLRRAVAEFKALIEQRAEGATRHQKLDARAAMWEFAGVRKETDAEIESLASFFRPGRVPQAPPPDYDICFSRICLASYLLDKLEEMAAKAAQSEKSAAVSLFISAKDAMKALLDDMFFFKGKDQIYDGYLDAQVALVCCAETLGVAFDPFDSAQKEYGEKVLGRIKAAASG